MTETRHFGRIVREKRELLGMEIRPTAERCELSYKGLINIERGNYRPKWDTVIRIAKVLELHLGDFDMCVPKDE